jgi:hypothetical protein
VIVKEGLTFIHTIQSHSVHPSPFAEARLLESSSRLRSSWGASMAPWDAEPRFELGPALQQADALILSKVFFQTEQSDVVFIKFQTFHVAVE